jgi:FkbM family methyltransferase
MLMLLEILRDNRFVNPIGRNVLRGLSVFFNVRRWMNRYRLHGKVKLKIEGVTVVVYSESDDFIANEIYYGLGYEQEEFKLIKAITAASGVFIDVGANTGIFSIFASASNPDLEVICYEPHPGNFSRLVKNTKFNKGTKIKPFQLAVGDRESFIDFTIPDDNAISTTASVNGDFTSNFHDIPYRKISVQQVTLDTALSMVSLTRNDLIKIDVEYYELSVLTGTARLLDQIKPMLLVEILNYDMLVSQHKEMKDKLPADYGERIRLFLASKGYICYSLAKHGIKKHTTDDQSMNRNFLFMSFDFGDELVLYGEILRQLS